MTKEETLEAIRKDADERFQEFMKGNARANDARINWLNPYEERREYLLFRPPSSMRLEFQHVVAVGIRQREDLPDLHYIAHVADNTGIAVTRIPFNPDVDVLNWIPLIGCDPITF